jgi:hypothetical protein
LADFFGVKIPDTHDVGMAGEKPAFTGLDTADAHREATTLSLSNFFTPVRSVDQDGNSTTYLFGDEWKPFG